MPDFSLETAIAENHGPAGGESFVIGIDEAGRGPWAGPVVAAAVWLDSARLPDELRTRLDDSKKLTRTAREMLYAILLDCEARGSAALGIGAAAVTEIDAANILQASLRAMTRAAAALEAAAGRQPQAALIDGNQLPHLPCPARAVIKGDGLSLSIAAASIIAKVTRDRQMAALAARHPGYGWERNQGYGTAEHRTALSRLGVTPEHRRSFRPIREALTIR